MARLFRMREISTPSVPRSQLSYQSIYDPEALEPDVNSTSKVTRLANGGSRPQTSDWRVLFLRRSQLAYVAQFVADVVPL